MIVMIVRYMIILFMLFLVFNFSDLFAQDNNQVNEELLKKFHKIGITKCDNFIMQYSFINNSKHPNWYYDFIYIPQKNANSTKQATLVFFYGYKNDSVKITYSYVQNEKKCTLIKVATGTFSGSCIDNVNADYWYVVNNMNNLDYIKYKNPGGVDMYAKEIKVGNFKACITEYNSLHSKAF